MKNLVFGSAFLVVALASACNSGKNLSLQTTDTQNSFTFEARYPEDQSGQLEKYLDSALNNDLPLDQQIDLFVNIGGTEKFNLKAQKGWLEIRFDKKNSSLGGYMKVKKLTEGIKKKLTTGKG